MSKTALGIRYGTQLFLSKFIERNEEELAILQEVCETAVKGNTDFLTIVSENGSTYFVSKKILKNSIISIIEHDW